MSKTITVTHSRTGEVWDVPKNIYKEGGSAAVNSWIEDKIADRQARSNAEVAAARAQAVANTEAAMQIAELRELLAQQSSELAQLREQNEKLQSVGADGAASAMALMSASREASDLRFQMQQELAAMREFSNTQLSAVNEVAAHLRDSRSEEKAAREKRRLAMREHLKQQAHPDHPLNQP